MLPSTISHQRLFNQGLVKSRFQTPHEVVKWFGAVQAQDYPAAKWALGLRLPHLRDEDIDRAFNEGKILRTHIMRPTWHFVAPEDLCWMQLATSHRVKRLLAHYTTPQGLTEKILEKSNKVISNALQGENFLTRKELSASLAKAGVVATGMKMGFVVMRAELDALICSGPLRGKQFTYALVEERAPKAKKMSKEEALVELIVRYFTSHGPATLNDLGWWSGLTQNEIKQGMERVKHRLQNAEVEGKTYWFSKTKIPALNNSSNVHLLPNYDEYTIAYKDTRAVFNPPMKLPPNRANVVFNHAIVLDGQIVGMWKRTLAKNEIKIQTTIFRELSQKEKKELNDATKKYEKFLGFSVKLMG